MKSRQRRVLLRDLSFFLEGLCLQIQVGFELTHGWAEGDPGTAGPWFEAAGPQPWKGLSRSWPIEGHRVWFALIAELHGTGAPLLPVLTAFATAIRQERARELTQFTEALPGRLALLLLGAYLPAAFLLLFGPLLLGLPSAF